ncbi:hypothetical protein OTU49_011592 [Cherax quadricarinatus]|uniref:Uncharacterized protein n=1 Tax=Cherax quadricarinatus TaxID=27406 RepID=A0AAW0W3X8_CHEQU|nr:uncharacterized protein LOC128698486 [Cherax quadricarinatus]XP_053646677.1 uncharacterized protein LOC128698486 [Cherax quadricarinatus]XP_053646678.1 uncharacterized protein LOC128698486 [Cherax quadricarinatus]XP_053646679.1 uncharacterized protein LOC128698486 [Cherax quadricarinatus]XP_053646681.1 uncharacterized protein LOC128698486 [Cherax quadricarinatus]
MRASGSTSLNLETTTEGSTEDKSVSETESSTSTRVWNPTHQTGASNVTPSNSDRPPPAYPCQEECIQCGKKVPDTTVSHVTTNQQVIESDSYCICECHKQTLHKTESSGQISQGHIPPAGPHCLSGCGYSGLPCYNCSLLQEHLQPQGLRTTGNEGPSNPAQTFSPQIFTIELMEHSSSCVPGARSVIHHQQIITEDNSQETRRRKMCFSIVVFVIAINVFVGVFRMLIGTSTY